MGGARDSLTGRRKRPQWLPSALQWGLRTLHHVRTKAAQAERMLQGFARAALTLDDLKAMTIQTYAAQSDRFAQPFPWEERWWKHALPATPGRILVGGCGRGREVRALIARGYEVSAFDPTVDAARDCQQLQPAPTFVGCFGYEELAASVRADGTSALLLSDVAYDAVLMGWGSLSHVLDEKSQADAIKACARLAPHGPVLASFLITQSNSGRGRAERIGYELGARLVRAGRAVPHADQPIEYVARGGFVYFFSEPRLEALARECGRRLELNLQDGYPHATFWPV